MTNKKTHSSSKLPDYLVNTSSIDLPDYSPIQCQIYDYIEIACMRRYQIEIELTSAETIKAKAKQTRIKETQEFLVVELNTNEFTNTEESELEIRLDLIKSITALDKNADFKTIEID